GHAVDGSISGVVNEEALDKLARYERQTASPGAAATILHHNVNMDVRHALNAVRVPTLIVHRRDDPIVPVAAGRHLARPRPAVPSLATSAMRATASSRATSTSPDARETTTTSSTPSRSS